jgi:hypothetical protein
MSLLENIKKSNKPLIFIEPKTEKAISILINQQNEVDVKFINPGWDLFNFNSQLLVDNNSIEKYLSKSMITNDMVVIMSNVSLVKNSCLPCLKRSYKYDILLVIKYNKLLYHLMYPISNRYELFDATEYNLVPTFPTA